MLGFVQSHGFDPRSSYLRRSVKSTESGLIVGVYWPRAMVAAEARTTRRVDNIVEGC